MTTLDATHRPPAATFLRAQARNTGLAGYMRLALWTWGTADSNGHARAWPGELQQALMFSSKHEVSRAIEVARRLGLVDGCSSAKCMVMPGCSLHPCGARHRGGL